ncbi:hypothetical protein CcaverHIS002_0205370 [Cutaneotrichosporon cavernicola]|nr:hypothetical protein CcaverHIS002_0205370 [Cutaneotrichosporon cavernicola]
MARPRVLPLARAFSASASASSSTPISRGWPTGPTPPGANYPTHVPLNVGQNALLAIGSGLVGVVNYATRPDLIATLSESTAASFLPRLHEAMSAHPEGRQILRDRPVVSSDTVNLDSLRSMRRGTVGREYVEWLDRDGILPDSREAVRYIDSPALAYTMLRYRQTHDLYHTLFCLPPTLRTRTYA